MRVEDLIQEIYESNVKEIGVDVRKVRHGNKNQEGDYSQVKLTINEKEHTFTNENGSWAKK